MNAQYTQPNHNTNTKYSGPIKSSLSQKQRISEFKVKFQDIISSFSSTKGIPDSFSPPIQCNCPGGECERERA